jgi:hypothetical protein
MYSVRVFSITCDSALNISIVSKWRFLQLGKQRKVAGGEIMWEGLVGDDSHVVLVENSLVKKEVWDGAFLWCSSQFVCRQTVYIFMQPP